EEDGPPDRALGAAGGDPPPGGERLAAAARGQQEGPCRDLPRVAAGLLERVPATPVIADLLQPRPDDLALDAGVVESPGRVEGGLDPSVDRFPLPEQPRSGRVRGDQRRTDGPEESPPRRVVLELIAERFKPVPDPADRVEQVGYPGLRREAPARW